MFAPGRFRRNTLDEQQIKDVLKAAEGDPQNARTSPEEQEVVNAARTLDYVRQYAGTSASGVVSEELIRTLHRLNTEGCDYDGNIPGEYRHHNARAGEYQPPDHQEIERLMKEFIAFINSAEVVRGYKAPIRAILAHFYLISIHPFGDGNGRASRAVEAYILYQAGYNVRGFYSLANFYYRNRQRYIELLQDARFKRRGDLTQFTAFSLEGFAQELERLQEEIPEFVRIVLFRDLFNELTLNDKINTRNSTLLEYLTRDGLDGIPLDAFRNRKHYFVKWLYENRTPKTLQRDLNNLLGQNLVALKDGKLVANLELMDDYD